jgi:acetylornithine/N-succinyldiaminopimelate aminotransferase
MSEPSTEELFSRYVVPTYGRFPLCLARGQGSRVWDEEGREYLDFGAGIAVCSLGHAHPKLTEALVRQSGILSHTSNLYYTRSQGRLAERITSLVGIAGKCFFCNSGGEANEALYKLARKFGNETRPGRRFEVITFLQSFHGRSLAGIAATGQDKVRKGFDPVTPGFRHAKFNDLASVKAALTDHTAAILLEPIQGESGIVPAQADFLRGLRQLCNERDLLLMFDEIQCGFGRTGDWCAWRSLGAPEVEPDAISWAKGMAGGFPMGAIWVKDRPLTLADGARKSLTDLLGPGSHGTTFGGNPLGCETALACFEVIESENLLANAAARGAEAKERLKAVRSPIIKEIRGTGLMLGIELDAEAAAGHPFFQGGADRAPSLRLVDRLQDAGLLTVPSGTHILRWLPPLNVTADEIARAADIFDRTLSQL